MKRTEKIEFRVSENEKEQITQRAKEGNLSLSKYCRQVSMNRQLKLKDADRQLLIELGRIGNNLNQVAKQLNQTGKTNESINPILEGIKIILKQIYYEPKRR